MAGLRRSESRPEYIRTDWVPVRAGHQLKRRDGQLAGPEPAQRWVLLIRHQQRLHFGPAQHLQNGLVHNYLVTIDSSGRTLLFNGNVVLLSGPTTDCYVAIDLKPNTNYHVYV